MSATVLSTISSDLPSDVIDAMAGRAEMDRASARKAAELGVPAIVAALAELVSKSSGVARLTSALAGQSTGPTAKQNGGGDVITFLLGREAAGALASAVGRFVGASEGSTHAFLDELTSRILRVLAREHEKTNTGGKGVANLLKGEKDPIVAAMPAGLASLLGPHGSCYRLRGSSPRSPIGRRVTASAPKNRPTTGTATGSAGRQRFHASWTYLALSLAALAGIACYLLAAEMEQTGRGGSDVVASTLPEPQARPAVQPDFGAVLNASAQYQGRDVYNRAAEKMGAVRDMLAGLDRRIALALVSLARFLGIGEETIAVPAAELRRAPDQNGMSGPPSPPPSRQHLRFVSPELRDAIRANVPTTVDRPAGPAIAAQ